MNPRVAVATPGPASAAAALEIATAGGNAVDAAVAAAVVATCSDPGIVSPMGGAFVNIWRPGSEPVVIDGNAEMPGRGLEAGRLGRGVIEVTMGYGGGITVHGGPGSVATPGLFAALEEASRGWGVVPWADLLAPAARVLRRGYHLGATSAYYLGFAGPELFGHDEGTRAFLAQAGSPPTRGALMKDPLLADTLDHIGRAGAADLYTGELAGILAADLDRRGGILTAQDLAAYTTTTRPALRSRLRDWDLGLNPPPSIGGPVLTAMTRLLEQRHEEAGRTDADDVVAVQRLALDYRRRLIDVAEDLETAGRELVELLDRLGPDGLATLGTSPDTIHVSVVDSGGLACAITATAGYGSGVMVPGTGLLLNNALGEPELNRRGLHALAPGTRLASNMAPTTARRDDGAMLAIGSPGSGRITTALLQVLGGLCLDGLPLQAAVDQPRLHVGFEDDGTPWVRYEECEALESAVRDSGMHPIPEPPLTMYFGGVGATLRDGDALCAAADPRRAASAVVG